MSPPLDPPQYGLRVLLALAWPVVVARSTQAVIGFCDALMTAPLGEAAMAATTTGAMNAFALAILPMGVVFIVQSFASQLYGKGDLASARAYGWHGLILAAIAGAVSAAAIPLVDSGLALLPYESDVHRAMTDYIEIRLLSIGAFIAVELIGNWYGGLGNTRLHMIAGILMMVVNVALNWVLIFGNLGAPALGVEGAAWASVIASLVGLGFLFACFYRSWFVPGGKVARVRLRMREMLRVLRFGLPNGLNWFLEFGAFTVFVNVVVADLGTTVLAAMMAVVAINSVSFMPAFGISSSGAILSGQAIGAGHHDEVPSIVRRTISVTIVWQGSVAVLYLAMPTVLMRAFAPPDEATTQMLEIGRVLLMISAAWQLFDSFAMVLSETLRAAGDTAWTLYARIAMAWFVFVPTSVVSVMVLDGGHVAAMLCVAGYIAVLAGVFLWRFRGGAWRRIDLTGSGPELVP